MRCGVSVPLLGARISSDVRNDETPSSPRHKRVVFRYFAFIEAETRNRERMDLVIDYLGERCVVELKIWRGNSYNERGKQQLANCLDYYHLQKGYMLSFCFNKNKKPEVRHIQLGDKELVEAIV